MVYADPVNGGFYVRLSTGDGVYGAASKYPLPGGALALGIGIGDFNSDGKADLVIYASDNNVYVFLRNSGGFAQHAVFAATNNSNSLIVADFNHDGRMDIALGDSPVNVWFGDGTGAFTAGPSVTTKNSGYVLQGDFDGDGNADIAIGNLFPDDSVQIMYGDGTGHFPASSFITTGRHSFFAAADVDTDGRTDIIVSIFYPGNPNHSTVYFGAAARTWAKTQTIPLSHCASDSSAATAADVNGDGINDLVVPESNCATNGWDTRWIGVLTRNANGTYNPEQTVYSDASVVNAFEHVVVLRADRNTKPDIALSQCNANSCSSTTLQVLLNTTTGSFPACAAPNAFEGIHMCSPIAGSTVTSPVHFSVGAAGQTPMRKVEVWVDGHKVTQQLDGFSNYTFMDQNVTIGSGSHKITIFAAGWDNWLEKTSFALNVP